MYSAKFVFAALAVKDATEFDGIWIVKHIPKLKTLKIKFDLALVGGDASDFDRGHTTIGVPFDTKISRFPTAEQWLASFSDEIRQYATNLSQKSA